MPRCGGGRLKRYGDLSVCGAMRRAVVLCERSVRSRECREVAAARSDSSMRKRSEGTLRQRKAKPSAIGTLGRRADIWCERLGIMRQLAGRVAHGSVRRE